MSFFVSDQTPIHVVCVSSSSPHWFLLWDLNEPSDVLQTQTHLLLWLKTCCMSLIVSWIQMHGACCWALCFLSDFCGLTVGCFLLCVTHWASRVEVIGGYHEYTDVKSCQDVVHLYHLLWSATILNIVALFLGIITAAVLGGFKDMVG